ncbi:MAG: L-lysine 6-transaminase [Candidatus Heimdallarchaeota archaeon]|nr:L-lysine 6-transaminase [Candidatus Heimdallarchaeota archaeon]
MDVIQKIGQYMLADGYDMVIDLEKSSGIKMYDKKHDKTYLDFFSFFASAPIGFNHPKMLEDQEFLKNLQLAALHKVSNSDIYTEQMAHFVDTFGSVAMHAPMKYSFFVSGGALAVENALKTAFDWKVRKNFASGMEKELGSRIVHFKQAFHGRTGYTMSMTNTADPRKYMYFPKFDWPRVDNPGITYPYNEEEILAKEKTSINQINDAFDKYPGDIAAIIIEPIQSEGGDIHFRKEYLCELRKIANEREAMLIYDEVQTGVGITGKMWAYEHFEGAEPDIIAFGKKTQVCGIMSSKRVDEVENNVFHESSRINSTWGGNIVDMVRSAKYLEIITEDKLIDNATKIGTVILKGLKELEVKYDLMTAVRGRGLLIAFDLPTKELRNKVVSMMQDEGILVLISGVRSVRIRPHLITNEDHVNLFLNAVDTVFSKLKA